jgi:hypothetical protein
VLSGLKHGENILFQRKEKNVSHFFGTSLSSSLGNAARILAAAAASAGFGVTPSAKVVIV